MADGGGARIELRREDGQVVTVFDGAVPFHSRKSAEGAPLFAEPSELQRARCSVLVKR